MNTKSLFSVVLACAGVAWAEPANKAAPVADQLPEGILLRGSTDKEQAFYAPNEPITFTMKVDASNAKGKLAKGFKIVWTRTGDDGKTENGEEDAGKPVVVKTSLSKPGFVRLVAHLKGPGGKVFGAEPVSFNGGAGVQPEKLKSTMEPKDFDEFWTAQKAKLAKVSFKNVKREKQESKNPKVEIYAVSIPCAGPRPVTGYITIPVEAKTTPMRARLLVDGYSGNRIQRAPKDGPVTIVELHINAHGYELGKPDEYYKAFYESIKSNGNGYALDTEQNKDRDKAYFNGMSLRVMRALQYLKSLPEWNKKDLCVQGGSQGGLQTIWGASLDPDVTEANASVPWCCNLAREPEGRIGIGWGVHYTPAILYFDPIYLAKRINKNCKFTIPRAGLGDYVCPPSGVAILYNVLPCAKKIKWVQGSTHGFVPTQPNQQFELSDGKWE
ncbi:MAG: acetylxylan esterase [Kiritimatiellae bacterium]|nr:acetylxylan esterase [Kiritimatiellia bacterium]